MPFYLAGTCGVSSPLPTQETRIIYDPISEKETRIPLSMLDIDAQEKKRLDAVHHRFWRKGMVLTADEVFPSQRVISSLSREKILLTGHLTHSELIGVAPFTPLTYSVVCPNCIGREEFKMFSAFVEAGLLIPILSHNYGEYDEALRSFILSHDHISRLQLSLYRMHKVYHSGVTSDVHQKMHRLVDQTMALIEGRRNKAQYVDLIKRIHRQLHPPIDADHALYEQVYKAAKDKNLNKLKTVAALADELYECRSAQVLGAGLVANAQILENVPLNVSVETDAARLASLEVRRLVAKGLSIDIPTNIPIEKYIELVRDYQPRINQAIGTALPGGENVGSDELIKVITALNNEVERLKSTKRYAVLEACVGVYRNNSVLLGGTLLATAMALSGHILPCATAGAVALSAKIARHKGWLRDNPALTRLGKMISRDVQPYTEMLMKAYLRGSAPAINVLSLQRRIKR